MLVLSVSRLLDSRLAGPFYSCSTCDILLSSLRSSSIMFVFFKNLLLSCFSPYLFILLEAITFGSLRAVSFISIRSLL